MAAAAAQPRWQAEEPSIARIWNYWLGGGNYEPADTALAAEIEAACPQARQICAESRMFTARAALRAADLGIGQAVELGAGCPPQGLQVHDMARAAAPGFRVSYVEADPATAAELAVTAGTAAAPGITVAAADLRDPAAVLAASAAVIDPAAPVLLLACSVLQFLRPGEAAGAMAAWTARLAPGSMVAVAVPLFRDACARAGVHCAFPPVHGSRFTRRGMTALFGGAVLQAPGVRPARGLRPGWDDALPVPAAGTWLAAGTGIVPG